MSYFRKSILLFVFMFGVFSGSYAVAQTTVYTVGSTGPGGGKVFYVATTPFACGRTLTSQCTYLERSPAKAGPSMWCSKTTTSISGAKDTAIGTGYKNTMAMINAGCTTGPAVMARASTTGGQTDWYVPSKMEVKSLVALSGGLGSQDSYWSSTEVAADTAWSQAVMPSGTAPVTMGKALGTRYTHFIRAF